MNLKDFRKYYFLEEEYLEKEVYSEFHEKGFLTAEQFFAIIIWKRNASKTLIKRRLLNGQSTEKLEGIIKELSSDIFNATTKEEKLRRLLKRRCGIDISIASAILTILYPKDFTVYDFRVRGSERDITTLPLEEKIETYFKEYVEKVKASEPNLTLRDCDRALWGKSWYEDLQAFIKKSNCICDNPECAKCLSVNCEDDACKVHTKKKKEARRRLFRIDSPSV